MNKSKPLALNDLLTQSPGNIVSDMDGEKVMLSIRRGKYYNLGEVGGEIWSLLENPISAADIIQTLMSRYKVEYALCESQVVAFLDHLQEENLLAYTGASSSADHDSSGGSRGEDISSDRAAAQG